MDNPKEVSDRDGFQQVNLLNENVWEGFILTPPLVTIVPQIINLHPYTAGLCHMSTVHTSN